MVGLASSTIAGQATHGIAHAVELLVVAYTRVFRIARMVRADL